MADPCFVRQENPDDNSHYIYTKQLCLLWADGIFSVRFDGFTTSNQNRVWVWLLVDDPESPNGYAVRIGESGGMKFASAFPDAWSRYPPIELLQSARVLPDDHQEFRVPCCTQRRWTVAAWCKNIVRYNLSVE